MLFDDIPKVLPYQKSYRAGLLQAKAFRILKKQTNDSLAPFGVNATDWGILGLLSDNSKGLSYKTIADEMGVKAPYITRSITSLTSRELCTFSISDTDARIKIAAITPAGKAFVKKTEKVVMESLTNTLSKTGKRNLLGYLSTLIAIVENNQTDIEPVDLDHMV